MIGDPGPVHGDDERPPVLPRRPRDHLDPPGDPLGLAASRSDRAGQPLRRRVRSSTSSPSRSPSQPSRSEPRWKPQLPHPARRRRARGAPRAAGGQSVLADRAPAAGDAAVHHLGDHDLRRVLHGLLLHPGRPGRPVAGAGDDDPGRRRGVQHVHPAVVVGHPPLGGDVDQEQQPRRPEGRDPLDAVPRDDVPVRADQRVRPPRLRAEGQRPGDDLLRPDRPPWCPRLRRA